MKFINLKNGSVMKEPDSDLVLCLGNFDGVHKGHRQLIRSCIDIASKLNSLKKHTKSGIWFFESSSLISEKRIFSDEKKLETFSSLGLDIAAVADFAELKNMSGDEFVNNILKDQCHCIYALCGTNFRFGKNASSSSDDLVTLMSGNAYVIPLVSYEGETVSSTKIRSLICNGNIEKANVLLEGNYEITGTVIHGKALGRSIGLPTVNIDVPEDFVVPKNGIYVTLSEIDGVSYHSVTNIGKRPTVENALQKNIETHIIGYSGDCYDRNVKIKFIHRLRDEMKFDSVELLKNQILLDINDAEHYFKADRSKK